LTTASAARALVFTGISTSFFIGVLTLQHLRGYSAFEIGLAFLPTTLTLGVLSAGITARVMARIGARNLLLFGMATIIAALVLVVIITLLRPATTPQAEMVAGDRAREEVEAA